MGSLTVLALFALATSALNFAAKYEHGEVMQEHSALQKRLYNCFYPSGTPDDQVCAVGCGSNFTYCTNYFDCFNPVAGDKCCPDGGYCYADEYCAQDAQGNGYCCPISRPCTDATSVATYPGGYLTSTPSTSVAAATTTSSRSSSSSSTTSTTTVSKTASSSSSSSISFAPTNTVTSTTNPIAGGNTIPSTTSSTKTSTSSSQVGAVSASTGAQPTSTLNTGTTTSSSAAIFAQTTNAAPAGAEGRRVVQAIGGLALGAALWL